MYERTPIPDPIMPHLLGIVRQRTGDPTAELVEATVDGHGLVEGSYRSARSPEHTFNFSLARNDTFYDEAQVVR